MERTGTTRRERERAEDEFSGHNFVSAMELLVATHLLVLVAFATVLVPVTSPSILLTSWTSSSQPDFIRNSTRETFAQRQKTQRGRFAKATVPFFQI